MLRVHTNLYLRGVRAGNFHENIEKNYSLSIQKNLNSFYNQLASSHMFLSQLFVRVIVK